MIFELDKSEFYKCSCMLNPEGQIEAAAVLSGVNPGRFFVDNAEQPESGFIWLGNNDGFIFIGKESNESFNGELNAFIDHVIAPEATKAGLEWFEAICNHRGWEKTLEALFQHRNAESWRQRVYRYTKKDYVQDGLDELNQECDVMEVSRKLYENDDNFIHNIKFLHSKILSFWASPDHFFEKGIGYCVVHRNQVVSICFSGFVAGNVHCMDVETDEAFQGKKLAQTAGRQFVIACLERNEIPYWDCMESNKASISVAERLGFTRVFSYSGYAFPLNHRL